MTICELVSMLNTAQELADLLYNKIYNEPIELTKNQAINMRDTLIKMTNVIGCMKFDEE